MTTEAATPDAGQALAAIRTFETQNLAILSNRDDARYPATLAKRATLYESAYPAEKPSAEGPAHATPVPASVSEALAEITRMESDPTIAAQMADRGSPMHRQLNDRRMALYAAAYPEETDENGETLSPLDKAMRDANPVPSDPAEYEIDPGQLTDEDMPALGEGLGMVRTWLGDLGATLSEARDLSARFRELNTKATRHDPEEIETSQKRTHGVLRGVWREGFDTKLAAAKRVFDRLEEQHGPNVRAMLEETRMGDDAVTIMLFAQIAERRGW